MNLLVYNLTYLNPKWHVVICLPLWQVALQTWLPWRQESSHQESADAWGTWYWWTLSQDSGQLRPSTCRRTRHTASTCSRVLHRRRRNSHIQTQIHTETLEWCLTHTHTQQTHTEPEIIGALLLPKKKKNQDDTTLCAVKTKKWDEKNWSIIYRFSLTQCRILDEGLLIQENQHSLHTSSSSFSHEKSKSETF